ncbi:AAA family ATPase [Micromonospora sp. WMMD1128]|uniref:AAA family ATPase n=1 Tax=Micromonospora sp. WMMD1128 TaxID=3015150 RepID=UPI00248AE990|nr:AAA family ATPase [Micromonospora sp. WMMD1128]WBB71548.1 AAA family ATPase [Micromonospora sp. WMMD1128]
MTVRQSIVFNGDLGSGKSTVSVEIAKRLGLRRVSVGDLYRQMAQERQMTALQLNLHAELDQAVDGYVDQLQRDIAASGESLVMDSRLAWHFFTDALKVHMITEPTEAARRVLARPSGPAESYTSLEEARAKLRERSESERNRFIVRYGVDKARLRNYDLICDTTRATPEQVIQHVVDVYEGRLGAGVLRAGQPLLLLDPTRVYPTEDVATLRGLWDLEHAGEATATDAEAMEPLSIGYTGEYFFVVDGHRRLSAAVRGGLPMVAARLVAEVEEPVVGGMSAADFFAAQARPTLIHDWEDAHGITLPLPEHALLGGGAVLAGEAGAGV